MQALERNDPKAAYALLDPEVQARTSTQEFTHRWTTHATERSHLVVRMQASAPRNVRATLESTSATHDGRVLRWLEHGGHHYIVSGLPLLPNTSTPAQTVGALATALRRLDWNAIRALVTPELAARLESDMDARARAVAAALAQPGAFELSGDLRRAVLRYAPGRAIILEQKADGWRVQAFE